MNPLSIYLFLSLVFVTACNSAEEQTLEDLNVEAYIELLESDDYSFRELPPFSPEDIPLLLANRNNNEVVTKFPGNPISSFVDPDAKYTIGVLVLWTIESIRAVSIDSEFLIGRFPSQNPFVELKSEPYDWILDYNNEAYSIISQAYFDWWNDNENKNFIDFDQIDPISDTDYKWH